MVGCTTNVEEVVPITNAETKTDSQEVSIVNTNKDGEKEETVTTVVEEPVVKETPVQQNDELFSGYKLIEVDGGDLSGYREPKVVVDIGYGDREYWAFTNEYGQLVRVIADSLGGVSNAYNITPQNSTLNRHGDQAYMEDAIRKAGGVTNFEAIITYPNTDTQIPSNYQYTYTLRGDKIVDKFENVNPDEVNSSLGLTGSAPSNPTSSNTNNDISSVDTNGNGQVTIKEAKAAGFKMPITSDHWLYPYMDDRDGDGMVGE